MASKASTSHQDESSERKEEATELAQFEQNTISIMKKIDMFETKAELVKYQKAILCFLNENFALVNKSYEPFRETKNNGPLFTEYIKQLRFVINRPESKQWLRDEDAAKAKRLTVTGKIMRILQGEKATIRELKDLDINCQKDGNLEIPKTMEQEEGERKTEMEEQTKQSLSTLAPRVRWKGGRLDQYQELKSKSDELYRLHEEIKKLQIKINKDAEDVAMCQRQQNAWGKANEWWAFHGPRGANPTTLYRELNRLKVIAIKRRHGGAYTTQRTTYPQFPLLPFPSDADPMIVGSLPRTLRAAIDSYDGSAWRDINFIANISRLQGALGAPCLDPSQPPPFQPQIDVWSSKSRKHQLERRETAYEKGDLIKKYEKLTTEALALSKILRDDRKAGKTTETTGDDDETPLAEKLVTSTGWGAGEYKMRISPNARDDDHFKPVLPSGGRRKTRRKKRRKTKKRKTKKRKTKKRKTKKRKTKRRKRKRKKRR